MASPNDPLRDNRRVERDDIGRGVGAGWLWIWIWVIIIIILVVWFGGWGWGGYGGWWWGNRSVTTVEPLNGNGNNAGAINNGSGAITGATANAAPSGAGLAVLNATDKTPFIGKPFQVNRIPVQSVVNDHVLWIGENNATPMLVVLTGAGDNAANANISQGNLVNVTGMLQKSPPKNKAQSEWKVSGDDANRLEQEGAYIDATQVTRSTPQMSGQQ